MDELWPVLTVDKYAPINCMRPSRTIVGSGRDYYIPAGDKNQEFLTSKGICNGIFP